MRCADDSSDVGHTDNLELRLSPHHTGACEGYTATRRPLMLVWPQEFVTREEALTAQWQRVGVARRKKH